MCSFPVKYGEYSVIVRAKSSSNVADSAVMVVSLYDSNDTTAAAVPILTETIKCTKFDAANAWQSFYFGAAHKAYSATPFDKNLYVKINYNGNGVADLILDSITVMPNVIGIWDDDGVK
jgi:hypothetical protein